MQRGGLALLERWVQAWYNNYINSVELSTMTDAKLKSAAIPEAHPGFFLVRDDIIFWHDEDGFLYIGVEQFLLAENVIDL